MADDYEIVSRIVVRDAAGPGAESVQRRLAEVERSGERVGRSITQALGGALAGVAGGVGLGFLARGLVRINAEIQSAEVGLATLFAANYGVGAADALGIARDSLAGLRQDAAAGVGELADYLRTFQTVLGPGLQLGATTDVLRELTRNALAAGYALRGQQGMATVGFDAQQALTGQVGDRTTPIVMQALQAAGITAEAFRALDPAERVEALNRGFATFSTGVSLMGQTWDAQMSTLKDTITDRLRDVTRPVFDRWSDQLRGANAWLEAHRDILTDIAGRVGDRLLTLWDALIQSAGVYAAILAGAAALQIVPGAAGALGGVRRAAAAGAVGGNGVLNAAVFDAHLRPKS
jgi:hypothetical protein